MAQTCMSAPARPVVLFVDDERNALEGFRDAFRREPSEVVTALSAGDALKLLETRHIDVVVSDECMPQRSGSEFLAIVHERTDRVRRRRDGDSAVIAISDTGEGIPDSIQDRVFAALFTTKEVGCGSGQGLSVARSVSSRSIEGSSASKASAAQARPSRSDCHSAES